jgi:serine/threonine-protein kinase RsbW
VQGWLEDDGIRAIEAGVLVVVSELVTNAVVHAGTVLEITYTAVDGELQVGVRDQDPGGPIARWATAESAPGLGSVSPVAAGGRGLVIVEALADEWGVSDTGDGKRVWARWQR